jgi:hypothetical protein
LENRQRIEAEWEALRAKCQTLGRLRAERTALLDRVRELDEQIASLLAE